MDTAKALIAGIDIDGVLADPSHRVHYLEHTPKDWRAFFRTCNLDTVLPEGLARVNELVSAGVAIAYVSGRPHYVQGKTVTWLQEHGFPEAPMFLRPARDFRPAPALKREVYTRLVKEFDIHVIVDDDTLVVQSLRQAGFPVEHAQWYQPPSATDSALRVAQDQEGRT